VVVPYIRAAATDLNFTAALAIISVFMTQVIGVRAQGAGYFLKFFNVRTLWTKPFFGAMDLLVSLLELISELSKILSFTFGCSAMCLPAQFCSSWLERWFRFSHNHSLCFLRSSLV
jgi:hypothetical protein